MNSLSRLITVLIVLIPCFCHAGVLREFNFDNIPDWSKLYHDWNVGGSTPKSCTVENLAFTSCTVEGPHSGMPPDGFYGWYMSPAPTWATGVAPNGVHIDSRNHRGNTGKAVTFYDRPAKLANTPSTGGQLLFELPYGVPDLHVRYWMKFQVGYGHGINFNQKEGHISHYRYNNQPFTFFDTGGYALTVFPSLAKWAGSVADITMDATIRTDPSYQTTQLDGKEKVSTYFDIPSDGLPIGNYGGTGTDWDSPGMFGDGQWHMVEFYLKNNSAPGVADGVYKFWFDGYLQEYRSDLIYREATSTIGNTDVWNMVHIAGNSFFGATDDGSERWRAYDDIVAYTPLTASDPQWATSPQDGRLPLDYTIASTAPADTNAPTVLGFTLPATYASLTVPITTFAATDETGVTGYAVTATATPPASWSAAPPATVTAVEGANTFYAWARDAAGNVSTAATATVTVTLDPPYGDPPSTPRVRASFRCPLR